MKIILFGASGFIGSSLLTHCLQEPSLTSLIVISRRQLPSIASLDPRIKVIVLENFLTYPESVINELTGAKACFWFVV
jgi:nucleoside-diphosphate-sugar epimerase